MTLPRRVVGYRPAVLAAAAVGAVLASVGLGGTIDILDGRLYDLALAGAAPLRDHGTGSTKVAVVALDRRSLASPELANVPRVLMGANWAKMIDALVAADARAIGFDIIFSFNEGRILPDSGRAFADALARNRAKLVLGRTLTTTIAPPYFFAIGGNRDPLAAANAEVAADADGVIRRVRRELTLDNGATATTLAAALLRRTGVGEVPAETVLAPAAHLETLPTYALIDVLRCAERDPSALKGAFAGRYVLVGTTLPEEDRKRAPDSHMPPPRGTAPREPPATEGCDLPHLGASDPMSASIPGVFIHAAAVEAMLGENAAREAALPLRHAAAGLAGLAGGAIGLAFAPWFAVVAVVAFALALAAIETGLLAITYWLPMALPIALAAGAMVGAYFVRFLVEERRRRRIEHAFGHYLAPSVVQSLLASNEGLKLGGANRDVSIMFADLSGFTALSGRVGPEALMDLTNQYLHFLAEAVDTGQGYVDKFIGDAVMAIWGAPMDDADHAAHAAAAALAAVARVDAARQAAEARGEIGFSVKIGINTGLATVGNAGSPRRLSYTAVGETVNIAARLESVPGDYGCRIVVGPETAARLGDRFLLNELDQIKVKGKSAPLRIFELIAASGEANPADRAYVAGYAAALACYRQRQFADAEARWRTMDYPRATKPGAPTPPSLMADRAAEMQRDPPPADWDGVWIKAGK